MNNNTHVLKSIGVTIKHPTSCLTIDTSKLSEKELIEFYEFMDDYIIEGIKKGTIYVK